MDKQKDRTLAELLKRAARAEGLEDRTQKNGAIKFKDNMDFLDYLLDQVREIEEAHKE